MREIKQLHPKLQAKISELISICEQQGLKIGIGECVRTVAEQDKLYAQGRTTSGNKVTNAKGSTYSSMHQWGIAFDFYRNDGKGSYYSDTDGFFTKVGQIGKSIGLEWGGDWKSIKDKPHFQLANWGSTTNKLKSIYKTPQVFMKTWTDKSISYSSQIQDIGWQGYVSNGEISGTIGQGKRLEAIKITTNNGVISYKTHIQDLGWIDTVDNNKVSGTVGQGKRMEAIIINCDFPIKYRVHVQDYGWMDWKPNGQIAGTVGQAKRIEAIQIEVA